MTGLDCLREELLAKGFNTQQVNSKIFLGTLEVVANSQGKYTDLDRLEKDIKELKSEAEDLNAAVRNLTDLRNTLKTQLSEKIEMEYRPIQEYIDSFFEALEECETPEGRDALKVAQVFVNSCSVNTKYDNTAYIIALGSILSKGGYYPMEELSKVNPTIRKYYLGTTYDRRTSRYKYAIVKDNDLYDE